MALVIRDNTLIRRNIDFAMLVGITAEAVVPSGVAVLGSLQKQGYTDIKR